MEESRSELIDVERLRPGMFVELDVGWLAHPFPTGHFKITSEKQIEIIRGLRRGRVRWVPGKSDPPAQPDAGPVAAEPPAAFADPSQSTQQIEALRQQRAARLMAQRRELIVCERRFGEAARQYKQVLAQMHTQPLAVKEQCTAMVQSFVGDVMQAQESAIRLLSDGMGDKLSVHPVNVSILCLLLGKHLGLAQAELQDLGLAAFLHDIGKTQLPERVRWFEEGFSGAELRAYQDHVAQGVRLGQRMELPAPVLQALAQHHEMADGSGFPGRVRIEALSRPAKILALVNRYEGLCNPSRPASAMTPHEALALIFAQLKPRFDPVVLGAFIRMMGVYPPGSVVQLQDDRYAMVVSVNSSRPLKPRVTVFDPKVPKDEALILDLETLPELGIRRSLKPAALPRAALDYLSPRQRICYFFERAADPVAEAAPP